MDQCLLELKQAVVRIEEQLKLCMESICEQKAMTKTIVKHDVQLEGMIRNMIELKDAIESFKVTLNRFKGIAIGLGMAGGAVVSVLGILVQALKP